MNAKLILSSLTGFGLAAAVPVVVLALGIGANAGATASVGSTTVSAKVEARVTIAKQRADQEIERRIAKMTAVTAKVNAMAKISDSEKSSIAGDLQSQISELTTLKAKIDADTDSATLKTDIQSIAKTYRIFMLIVPQASIEVAADRIQSTASLFTEFSSKLSSRISQAQADGKDTASASASLSDMNTKVANANAQASAAVSLVANLSPDNGDKTVQASNEAALKNARADLKIAQQDLVSARQDAHAIVQTIHSWSLGASASASTTAGTH